MKNALLLLTFIFIATMSFAQNCEEDDTLPADFIGISPLADTQMPCDTLVPETIAWTGVGYSTTFTVSIPSDVNNLPLDYISVNPASDANPGITGLPSGLTYSCEPEDCVFPAGQPGCLRVHGIVGEDANLGINDLLIVAHLKGGILIDDDIRFPLPDDPADYNPLEATISGLFPFPECPYQIMVEETAVSTQDLFENQFSMGQNNPNPFTGETTIPVNAAYGDYTFTIHNTVGELVHKEELQLQGRSNIPVDASNYEPGVYFYTFSNGNGSMTKKMIVR